MRILLVYPDCLPGPVGFRLAVLPEPLALEGLAALVPEHEVEILDARVDPSLGAAMERFAPDLVATTALTTEVYAALEVLRQAKRLCPDVFTAVGGHHATLLPEDFQAPFVDAVCLGDGELVFPQLVEAVAGGRPLGGVPNLVWQDRDGSFVDNGRSAARADMETVPLPRRDLVSKWREKYRWLFHQPDTIVATSRGCPYRCNFCSVWEFHRGRTCQMSPERVIEELRAVETKHISIVDDNFLMNVRREAEIARRIKAEGLRHQFSMECRTDSIVRHPELIEQWVEVGLFSVFLGLEGDDRILATVDKKNLARTNEEALRILKANGVVVWAALIVDPDWSADDFNALRDFIARMEISLMQITVLTPLPGTQLYRRRRHELLTHDYRAFDTLHAVLPTRLPREEFYRRYAALYWNTAAAPYYDMVESGQFTIEDLRAGWEWRKAMSRWENYIEGDPVLGQVGVSAGAAG
jgi:hopanoid C-3 methylase